MTKTAPTSTQKIRLAIIGSGPAGYSAAIYASRAQLEPVLFAGPEIGGQLMYTTEVENYPGFSQGIQGTKLMSEMAEQAKRFGTNILYQTVKKVSFVPGELQIWTDDLQSAPQFLADAVIVATGATAMMLGLPEEKSFLGRGLSSCAVCDAAFFKEKKVFVVGGGDSAMEDALALAKFTNNVTILHRRDSFRASKIMQDRVLKNSSIKVVWNTRVTKILGNKKLEMIELETAGKTQQVEADGLFLAIGHKPQTSLFLDQLSLTPTNYIVTSQSPSQEGQQLASESLSSEGVISYPSMTSVEGVFAAGDVVDLRYRQAITAAGSGAGAALDAEVWLMSQGK